MPSQTAFCYDYTVFKEMVSGSKKQKKNKKQNVLISNS